MTLVAGDRVTAERTASASACLCPIVPDMARSPPNAYIPACLTHFAVALQLCRAQGVAAESCFVITPAHRLKLLRSHGQITSMKARHRVKHYGFQVFRWTEVDSAWQVGSLELHKPIWSGCNEAAASGFTISYS